MCDAGKILRLQERTRERGHTMTHVDEILVGSMVDQELDALMVAIH